MHTEILVIQGEKEKTRDTMFEMYGSNDTVCMIVNELGKFKGFLTISNKVDDKQKRQIFETKLKTYNEQNETNYKIHKISRINDPKHRRR